MNDVVQMISEGEKLKFYPIEEPTNNTDDLQQITAIEEAKVTTPLYTAQQEVIPAKKIKLIKVESKCECKGTFHTTEVCTGQGGWMPEGIIELENSMTMMPIFNYDVVDMQIPRERRFAEVMSYTTHHRSSAFQSKESLFDKRRRQIFLQFSKES